MATTTRRQVDDLIGDFQRDLRRASTRAAKTKQRAPVEQAVSERLPAHVRAREAFVRLRQVDEESMRRRLRLQYQPWLAAGAVAAIGLIQELALLAEANAFVTSAGTALAISTTIALIRRAEKGWLLEAGVWLREHPLRALLVGAAAWVWLIAAALTDQWEVLASSGLVGVYVLAAHWWRIHRIGHHPQTPAMSSTVQVDDIAALWAEHIGSRNGAASGSWLSDQAKTEYGREWTIHFKPTGRGLEALEHMVAEISVALNVPKRMITVGPHDSESPQLALLRITDSSPTAGIVPVDVVDGVPTIMGHPVYDPETGDITVGPHSDGVGMHTWGLYRPNSLLGGYLFGAQKSGKSELLNLLALGMRMSGCTIYWYVDGQEGTQPALQDTADWDASATAELRRIALEAAVIVLRVRMRTNRAMRRKGFTPTPSRPGLVLILDESHMTILSDYRRIDPQAQHLDEDADPAGLGTWTNAELVNELTRIGRKCGVAVIAASQDTGMGAFGGDGNPGRVIRGNLFSANVALMYSQDAIGGAIAPKAPMSVTELPRGGGYGIAANETTNEGSVEARRAMWRAGYHEDLGALIQAVGPSLTLEPEAARAVDLALGGVYSRRHDRSAEQRAAEDAHAVTAFLGGKLGVRELLFGEGSSVAPRPSAGVVVAFPNVADFVEVDQSDRDRARDAILAVLAAGPQRRGDIEAAVRAELGCSRATVNRALDELAEAGTVRLVAGQRGLWERRAA
ncbi:hypothetical protein [Allonocardiopsis opalescens]|uniref:Uncharacterized protein n=1 Tax=Allonocardiopsis opalescens TaxID=1144618 RepID=A0A2T0PSX4_9ACTN|nr:hypothetical protein [Allonocardiopsis opalescens]PRX92011.1 hypothetical protein CLV72_11284 [Allonocardiopsis opalescens]